jgi:hypothetical protein
MRERYGDSLEISRDILSSPAVSSSIRELAIRTDEEWLTYLSLDIMAFGERGRSSGEVGLEVSVGGRNLGASARSTGQCRKPRIRG